MSSVYSVYTGSDELIGMDHPLFGAKWHAHHAAVSAAQAGQLLSEALPVIRAQVWWLFGGEVPAALIDAQANLAYASALASQGALE